MTDKEKFRKEVEKLKSSLIHGACSSQIAMETRCKEEAYNEVLVILDTMQEEPVNRTPADVESAMQEVEEKSRVFTEAHKGEDADTILAQMRGEEPVSIWHDIEELPIAREYEYILVIYKDTTTPHVAGNKTLVSYWDRVDKWAYLDDVLKLSNFKRTTKNWKEPISEDLSEYINELSKQFPEVSFAKLSRIAVRVAQWQKEKEYTCYEEAFEDGAKWKKEQIMKDAVEAKVYNKAYPTEFEIQTNTFMQKLKHGDNVKLIIIKEN